MKYIILTAVCLTLVSIQEVEAQNGRWVGGIHHSSTAAEGYLRGRAALRAGQGRFLEGVGRYEQDHQDAISKSLDNSLKRAQTYWERKEIYKKYNKRPNYIERKSNRLDLAEARHALKLREEDLIKKGVLPPKKVSGFYYDGVFYNSWAEFEGTHGHLVMQLRARTRQLERENKERAAAERRVQAVKFGQMWSKMSWISRERYGRLSAIEKEEYKKEYFNPEYRELKRKLRDSKEFYEKRPYLLPRAGKNGLPPSPNSLLNR